MCAHTRDLYSKFHRNPFIGFGAPGGRNLPIPITLAIGFYKSLYYQLFVPRVRTTVMMGSRGFCYAGPASWNALPPLLRDPNLKLTDLD